MIEYIQHVQGGHSPIGNKPVRSVRLVIQSRYGLTGRLEYRSIATLHALNYDHATSFSMTVHSMIVQLTAELTASFFVYVVVVIV